VVAARSGGQTVPMLTAIIDAILMVLGLILDIITLPFRLVIALLGGAKFEFQRFSRRRD
jgi:hypothetical protein